MFSKSNRFHVAAFAGFLFLLSLGVRSQVPTDEQIIAKTNEYMAAVEKTDKFSGTILIARDGKPVVSKGYGMANYEWGIANTPQTVFRLGSITKQFTSAAIMLLQERGKLTVNDAACKYVADCPAAWEPITIKQLLSHTSGIPNYTSFPEFTKKAMMPISTTDLMADYRSKPLDYVPGEKYAYSNSGYHLLGLIVEKASGKGYAEFLQENIFTPLGMTQTGYDNPETLIKWRANGYAKKGDGFVNAAYMDMLQPYAAGALYSTTGDLLIWDQALLSEKLLKQKSLDEMYTPVKGNYAYGWSVGKRGTHKLIGHGGGIYGFATQISRFPDDRVTVVVLSNVQGAGAGSVANNLSAIAFGEPPTLPKERKAITLPSATLDRYVGEYQLLPNVTATITNEAGKLFIRMTGQGNLELFAETEKDFFLKVVDAQVSFETDASGKATKLLFKQGGGGGMPAPKIK